MNMINLIRRYFTWEVWFFAGLAFLIYANVLHGPFQLDDEWVIVNNYAVQQGSIFDLFQEFNTRFLVGLSFALNYRLSGLHTFSYHLVNVIIHIIAAISLWTLIRNLFRSPALHKHRLRWHSRWIAFCTALIFLVHPLQTQSVSYIWQRTTSMAGMFYMLSLTLYVASRRKHSWLVFGLSMLFAIAAMLSKEIAVTLPIMIGVIEIFFFKDSWKNSRRWIWKLSLMGILIIIIPLLFSRPNRNPSLFFSSRVFAIGEKSQNDLSLWFNDKSINQGEYYLKQVNVLRKYLVLLVMPTEQSVEHDPQLFVSLSDFATLGSLMILILFLLAAAYFYRRDRLISFGIIWFFITISVETIVPMNDIMAEQRMYLPSAGLFMGVVCGLFYLFRDESFRAFWAISVGVILFSLITVYRNSIWADSQKLWSEAVEKAPYKSRALTNLGVSLERRGDDLAAMALYEQALINNHRDWAAHYNQAVILARQENYSHAEYHYKEAINIRPDFVQAINNLGNLYELQGRFDLALMYYQDALLIDSQAEVVLQNLSRLKQKMK